MVDLTVQEIRQQAQRFRNLTHSLQTERDRRQARVDEIDGALADLGIDLDRVAQRRAEAVSSPEIGEQPEPEAETVSDTPARRSWARVSHFLTAREFVLDLLERQPGITTGEINAAWERDRRKGTAATTLTVLAREGKIHRESIAGQRGSRFWVVKDGMPATIPHEGLDAA